MFKFDELFNRTKVLLEVDPGMVPGGTTQTVGAPSDPQTPMPDIPAQENPALAPEVAKVSTEGRRFLVDLALKALSFDPNQIPDSEKAIFDQDVTIQNADQILKQIRSILSGVDVQSSADDGYS